MTPGTRGAVAIVTTWLLGHAVVAGERPLDAIPARIDKGDIVVAAVPFADLPRTSSFDTVDSPRAAVQSLQPIPDGSGRLAISDLRGVLYITEAAGGAPRAYLDLRKNQGVNFLGDWFQSGLFGFAFHPQFGQPGKPGHGRLYTAFTAPNRNMPPDAGIRKVGVIREWRTADHAADVFSGTSRQVLRVELPGVTHGIGTIAFNPTVSEGSADYGLLYASFGDSDDRFSAQDLGTTLGAIIRIDPIGGVEGELGYDIPKDNPFVGVPGAASEVWAFGLRHPQQFSWDGDGRMFIADIGHHTVEEINLGVAGGNYGWPLREGAFATKEGARFAKKEGVPGLRQLRRRIYERPPTEGQAFIYPVAQYDHDEGLAIAGGFVYRGKGIPELRGKYVFTDIVRGRVFLADAGDLVAGGLGAIEELRLMFDGEERQAVAISSWHSDGHHGIRADLRLGIDQHGELYLLTKGDGRVRRIVRPAGDGGGVRNCKTCIGALCGRRPPARQR